MNRKTKRQRNIVGIAAVCLVLMFACADFQKAQSLKAPLSPTAKSASASKLASTPKEVSLHVAPGQSYKEVRMNSRDTLKLVLDQRHGRIWRLDNRIDGAPVLELKQQEQTFPPRYKLFYLQSAKDERSGNVIGGRCFIRLETIKHLEDGNDWSKAQSSEIEVLVSTRDI